MKVRYYLDENVQIAIAERLRRRNIEVITVRDLGMFGDEDINHLVRATHLNYVLWTHDADYVDLAVVGTRHAGIVFAQQHKHTIGDWVRFLELIHGVYTMEDMCDLVEYL